MDLFTGTSGFSYKEWKPGFYPEDVPQKGMLAYYATRLSAVEINNTFYRLPKASVLEGWAAQVPEEFRFVLKASRRITHFKRLKEEADEETAYLVKTAGTLGRRLGALLFQLPPNFKKDVERLERFLDGLPAGTPGAFEFRHESWLDDEVYELFAGRDQVIVIAETDETERLPDPGAASWGYLRLRKTDYGTEEVGAWAESIRERGWQTTYAFFKHKDAAEPWTHAERLQGLLSG